MDNTDFAYPSLMKANLFAKFVEWTVLILPLTKNSSLLK